VRRCFQHSCFGWIGATGSSLPPATSPRLKRGGAAWLWLAAGCGLRPAFHFIHAEDIWPGSVCEFWTLPAPTKPNRKPVTAGAAAGAWLLGQAGGLSRGRTPSGSPLPWGGMSRPRLACSSSGWLISKKLPDLSKVLAESRLNAWRSLQHSASATSCIEAASAHSGALRACFSLGFQAWSWAS